MVAAYGFSEGEGTTVVDASGNSNTGTIDGPSWTSIGRFGSALTYDGKGWVTVEDAASLDLGSGMTVEAWVFPTMTPGTWTTIAGEIRDAGRSRHSHRCDNRRIPWANPIGR